ncbi:MAG: hypothetical protein ACFNM5_01965 [Candidatus Saccharibacteria bacterium]
MSKRKVTFIIWSMFDGMGDHNFIEVSKVINTNKPLKNVAIEVLNSLEQPKINLGPMNIDNDTHLMIEPLPNNINIKEFVNNYSGFGIKYFINEDDSIRMLDRVDNIHSQPQLTIDKLDQLSDLGYINYKKDHVVIIVLAGLGASVDIDHLNLGIMIDFIKYVILPSHTIITAIPKIKKIILNWRFDKSARKIAEQWKEQGAIYPAQLREFIDVKAEWTLSEVKTRLKLNEEQAIKLLDALGLEPINNSWRLTQTKNSINKRRRWIVNEKKSKEKLEQQIESMAQLNSKD